MNVIGLYDKLKHLATVALDDLLNKLRQAFANLALKDRTAKLGTPHEVVVNLVRSVASSFTLHKRIIPHF